MKIFFSILILIAFQQAHAADTSGCSPLRVQENRVVTAQNATLTVRSFKAPRASCWNVSSSYLQVAYDWVQSSPTATSPIHFWVQLDNQSQYVEASIRCQAMSSRTLSPDTSGYLTYKCRAESQVDLMTVNAVRIEIAPQVGDQWDTLGYQNNYLFEL